MTELLENLTINGKFINKQVRLFIYQTIVTSVISSDYDQTMC